MYLLGNWTMEVNNLLKVTKQDSDSTGNCLLISQLQHRAYT